MSRMIRSAVLALVLANLVASAAFALPRVHQPLPAPRTGLTAVWEWLVSLLVPAGPVAKTPGTGIMAKAGSSMDPNGGSHASTIYSGSTTDAGVIWTLMASNSPIRSRRRRCLFGASFSLIRLSQFPGLRQLVL